MDTILLLSFSLSTMVYQVQSDLSQIKIAIVHQLQNRLKGSKFFTSFPLPSISTHVICSQISNGSFPQPADQTPPTGSEQLLSTKPCLHVSSSLTHRPPGERGEKKSDNVYSLFQLIKGLKRSGDGMFEQMLPSCGQGVQSFNV